MSNTINITQEQINFMVNWADLRREVYNWGANYVFETGEDCLLEVEVIDPDLPPSMLGTHVKETSLSAYYEGDEPNAYPWLPQDYYLKWIKEGTDKWNSGMRKVPSLSDTLTEDLYFDCPNCLESANGDRLELEGCDMCDYEGEILKYKDDGKDKLKHPLYDEKNDCGTL